MIIDEVNLKNTLGELFSTRSSRLTNHSSIKKFRSVWALVDAFNFEQDLKIFLCREGDCKFVPYLFASIFFKCHTKKSQQYIDNLFNHNRNLQGRNKQDFAFDLIIGWIFELIIFKNFGLEKSGCDYDYMLEKGKSINSGADFTLGNASIELAVDNLGYSLERDVFHLRYGKWDRILEEEMFLFILCPNHMKYYLYHAYEYAGRLDINPVEEIKAFSRYQKVGGTEFKNWDNLPAFELNKTNLQSSFEYIQYSKVVN
jgi:hypothetical protein